MSWLAGRYRRRQDRRAAAVVAVTLAILAVAAISGCGTELGWHARYTPAAMSSESIDPPGRDAQTLTKLPCRHEQLAVAVMGNSLSVSLARFVPNLSVGGAAATGVPGPGREPPLRPRICAAAGDGRLMLQKLCVIRR